MEVMQTDLPGVVILIPQVFTDHRGWFFESCSRRALAAHGIDFNIAQINRSCSLQRYTLRGLHFQNHPYAQAKIIRCTAGSILDAAVDLRRDSPAYLQYTMVELSAANRRQLYIPRGFAHGCLTLTDNTEIEYLTDEFYYPEADRTLRFDDPAIGISWETADPILSAKDAAAPFLRDCGCNF